MTTSMAFLFGSTNMSLRKIIRIIIKFSVPNPRGKAFSERKILCRITLIKCIYSAINPQNLFSHKQTFATALKVLVLDFSFGFCTFSKQGSWVLFWPMDNNTDGSSLLCDVISGFHSHGKQAQTEKDSFLFLQNA